MTKSVFATLNGRQYELKNTIEAWERLDRLGGVRAVLESVAQQNFGAIVSTVVAGTGSKSKEAQRIKEDVFAEGLLASANEVVPYLSYILTGQHPDDEGDDKGNPGEAETETSPSL